MKLKYEQLIVHPLYECVVHNELTWRSLVSKCVGLSLARPCSGALECCLIAKVAIDLA